MRVTAESMKLAAAKSKGRKAYMAAKDQSRKRRKGVPGAEFNIDVEATELVNL
jgi:hypothetical protein